ncbi:hypothetical protein [Bradyrhizobium sp. 2]|uniref:hypothetical protein n=1 Tax=Bradyrhizobium sp. 2 TaxID=190045 RepID=UPI001FF74EF3|nr:hypothetical protein [Bradyrhizobium sp. 2]
MACFTADAVHYFPPGLPDIPWRGADTIARKWIWCVENLGSRWTIEKILCSSASPEAVIEWTHWKRKQGTASRRRMVRVRRGERTHQGDQGLLCGARRSLGPDLRARRFRLSRSRLSPFVRIASGGRAVPWRRGRLHRRHCDAHRADQRSGSPACDARRAAKRGPLRRSTSVQSGRKLRSCVCWKRQWRRW